jgi:hypothetical protein
MLGYGSSPELPTLVATANGIYTVETIANTTNPQNLYVSTKTATTQLSIDNVTVEEVNTGLQGYWKMGDGTNDEYPVIYDQTNPTNGSELVTNGDFSNGTTGWTNQLSANFSVTNGVATIESTGANSLINQNISPSSVNAILKIEIDVVSFTGDKLQVLFAGSTTNINQLGISTYYTSPNRSNSKMDISPTTGHTIVIRSISVKEVQGNGAYMTNMVEGNITNQYPLTKIRNYYRMGDGILDGYPIIQDQTSPNLAHIPTTNLVLNSSFTTDSNWSKTNATIDTNTNKATVTVTGGAYSSISQGLTFTNGNVYTVSAIINGTAGKEMRFQDNGSNLGGLLAFNGAVAMTGTDQNIEITWTANANSNIIVIARNTPSGDYSFTVSNVQIEEQSQATAYIKSDGIAAVRKSSTTNLITYSEDFNNATWTKDFGGTGSSPVITSNSVISPDGTQNGTKIVFDAGSGTTSSDQSQIFNSVTFPNNTIGTASVYLKGENGGEKLVFRGVADGTYTLITLTTEWQRFSTTEDSVTSSDKITFGIRQNVSGHGVINSSATVYAWGAQIEEQTQAETYAPTYGLPVTIDLFTENNYGTMTNMSASDIVEDTPNN